MLIFTKILLSIFLLSGFGAIFSDIVKHEKATTFFIITYILSAMCLAGEVIYFMWKA